MSKFINTNISRKVDSMGRITLPFKLRDKLNILPGDNLKIVLAKDKDIIYLCLECPLDRDKRESKEIDWQDLLNE